MKKNQTWQEDLHTFIKARTNTPFKWGHQDCCLFAADAVLAMTGKDPAEAFRGRYKTAIGSVRALARIGHGSIRETVTAIMGEPIPRLKATRGDMALFETDQGFTLGIVYGFSIIAPGETRLTQTPLANGLTFWSIDQWQ